MHFLQTGARSTKTDIWKAAQAWLSFTGLDYEKHGKKQVFFLEDC